jgi:hypothetical protein
MAPPRPVNPYERYQGFTGSMGPPKAPMGPPPPRMPQGAAALAILIHTDLTSLFCEPFELQGVLRCVRVSKIKAANPIGH